MKLSSHERRRLLTSLIATYIWGLAAHGYALLNLTISHDSLMEFYMYHDIGYYPGSVAQWKIALGRFLDPVYHQLIRGTTVSPWFSGMLALLWLSLAVWMMARIFQMERAWEIGLLSGIMTVNITVIGLVGTYLGDLDMNMLGVFFAVCAVYFWMQPGKRKLWAIACMAAAMGIYQSHLSVTVTLVMILSICQLLEGKDWKKVFVQGILAIGLMAAAAVIYLLLSKLVCNWLGIEMSDSANGIANLWLDNYSTLGNVLFLTYYQWMAEFCAKNLVLNLLVGGSVLVLVILSLLRPIPLANKALTLVLGILLPFGMNFSTFLANGIGHGLMAYAFWFAYLLLWLLSTKRTDRMRLVSAVLIFAVVFSNVRLANQYYTKRHLEREATLSLMTRVVDRLEQTEGYCPGETTVYFWGTPNIPEQEAFSVFSRFGGFSSGYELSSPIAADYTSPISGSWYYQPYFDHILQCPIRIGGKEVAERIQEPAAAMGVFPAKDSIQWVEDVLVVKMQDEK